jgi:hypothetical protein
MSRALSNWQETLLSVLQNGQANCVASFGFCFFGGGLLLFRFPICCNLPGLRRSTR